MSLLMGQGIAREMREKFSLPAKKDASVLKAKNILSTYQSPDEVVLMLIIDFEGHLDIEEITEAIRRLRNDNKNEFKFVHFVIIQPEY